MQKKGITLLLAILISSTASLLGLGIFMIVYGELGISESSKASSIAFYAADTGVDCSMYYDLINTVKVFATSTYSYPITNANFSINCNGSSVQGLYTPVGVQDGTHSGIFTYKFTVSPGESCATVTVIKSINMQTTINSFGENVPDCSAPNAKVTQRGLEVIY